MWGMCYEEIHEKSDGDTQGSRMTRRTVRIQKKRERDHCALPTRAQNISSRSRVSSFHVRSSHVPSPTYAEPSGANSGSAACLSDLSDLPALAPVLPPNDDAKSESACRSVGRTGRGWRGPRGGSGG